MTTGSCGLILGTLSLLAVSLRAALSGGAHNASPAALSCAQLSALSIFSHRGLSGEGNDSPAAAIPTEESLVALHRRGVSHFDMDLFFTEEPVQYVAHPDALAKVLGVPSVADLSSRQLSRAVGAASPGRQLLRVTRLLDLALERNLTLALDLKGAGRAAFRRELEWLGQQLLQRRLERRVSVWVEQPAMARRMPPALRLGKPLRDVNAPRRAADGAPECAAQLEARAARLYAFVGPSRKCANRHLLGANVAETAAWRQRPRGFLVWVVDAPAELWELAAAGVDQIISNVPVRMMEALQEARRQKACT
jgi:glycerophosphoryl diester phosphodiesterase